MTLYFNPEPQFDFPAVDQLMTLLISAKVICFFGSLDVFDHLSCLTMSQSFMIQKDGPVPSICTHSVLSEMPADTVIDTISGSDLAWDKYVLIVNRKTPLNMTRIQGHQGVFGFASVFVQRRNDTLALSSPYDKPRWFKRFPGSGNALHEVVGDVSSVDGLRGKTLSALLDMSGPFSGQYLDSRGRFRSGAASTLLLELSRHLGFQLTTSGLLDVARRPDCGAHPRLLFRCTRAALQAEFDLDVGFDFTWDRKLIALDARLLGPVLADVHHTLLVGRPTVTDRTWLTFLAVYDRSVWLCLAAAFAITTLAHWLTGIRRPTASVWESAAGAWSALLLQPGGGGAYNSTASARGLVLCWWALFALFYSAVFTADILNRITLPVYTARLDTVAEVDRRGFHYYRAEGPTKPNKQEPATGTAKGLEWGRLVLYADRHDPATVVPRYVTDLLPDERLRRFRAITQDMATSFYSVNARRGSPHGPPLTSGVQRFIETGVWQIHRTAARRRLRPAVRRLTVEEDRPSYESYRPLTVDNLSFGRDIHLAAVALGLVLLAAELALYHVKRKIIRPKEPNPQPEI